MLINNLIFNPKTTPTKTSWIYKKQHEVSKPIDSCASKYWSSVDFTIFQDDGRPQIPCLYGRSDVRDI